MNDEQKPAEAGPDGNDSITSGAPIDDDRRKAFLARDAAKLRAREAEAERDLARAQLQEIESERAAILDAKAHAALELVEPRLRVAAKAVIATSGFGVATPVSEIARALQAAGLIAPRNAGSPGTPGANHTHLPPEERPADPRAEQVRALASRMGRDPNGTMTPLPKTAGAAAATLSREGVADLAARMSADYVAQEANARANHRSRITGK